MFSGFRLLRTIALFAAVLAYAANGAKAGLEKASDGTLVLPICTVDGTHYLSVELPGEGPAKSADHKCGGCVLAAGVVPKACELAKPIPVFDKHPFVLPADRHPESAPIWPGAPPTGPPTVI